MTELPVLRVERPYSAECEFLRFENWTITKKSVFLIGAAPHAEGTILRCELVLASGVQLLVAEGIVAKYSLATGERPAGLVVRYRRMTPASSQFVNRTVSNRDGNEGSSPSAVNQPMVREAKPANPHPAASPPAQKMPAASRPAVEGRSEAREVLTRLSKRSRNPTEVPAERDTLLSRLRMRTAHDSR
jgi:hypothetical protein